MRSREIFLYTNLRFSRRRYNLHLDDQFNYCHWSLKKHKQVYLYLVVNLRKKESVDSELARGHVSKFYWLVALGSRARVLVSYLVWNSILSDSGFKFTLRIVRLNPPQIFTSLAYWVIISLCYLSFHCYTWYDCCDCDNLDLLNWTK